MRFLRELMTPAALASQSAFIATNPAPILLARAMGSQTPRKFSTKESIARTRSVAVRKISLPDPDATAFYLVEKADRNSDPAIVCGRGLTADVIINHDSISKHHATFALRETFGWHLTDLASRNGTFLSEARLQPNDPQPLGNQAEVGFGECSFTFYSPQALYELLIEIKSG